MRTNYAFINNRAKGRFAELHACGFLMRQGCTLVARNYAYRGGELDIVAKSPEGRFLFVEVKSVWKRDKGAPESRVRAGKQYKVWRTACHFLHFHGGLDQKSRFDVIAVNVRDGKLDIRHFPGAFEAKHTIADC